MPIIMKTAPSSRLGIAASALLISTLFAATARSQSAAQPPSGSAADDQGAALLVRMCNDCHDSTRIVEKRRTKADWQDVLTKMIENGAAGESREFEILFAYLCRNHGEVRINDAPPDEIAMTVGLSKKDADAVVAYRNANGAFSDFESVKKVPDIDLKALEAHKDAVVF
jgi:competence ComEA-like helix-hairpin-helix protein